jgi:predicted TPR repeat methyltransferase
LETRVPTPESLETEISRRGGASADEQLEIRIPEAHPAVDQDEEWCEVCMNGRTFRVRFHDYAEIYAVPGLYEALFYDKLQCCSPQTVCGLLGDELKAEGIDLGDLRILDLGAGNGMVGEQLEGADSIVGVDIIEEAAEAAVRDRPGVYEDYLVLDFTDLPSPARELLERRRLNCLITVAALGFGDIPPRAFAEAFNLIADDGWIAFNIKEDFLSSKHRTGFSRLIRRMLDAGVLERLDQREYPHRLSVAGEPLHYVALIGRKHEDVPDELVEGAESVVETAGA